MRPRVFVLVSCFMIGMAASALAQDDMTPLASDGDWAAMEHSDSQVDPPDVCLAMSLDGMALRTDQTDNEVRYINPSWSLPSNVSGTLTLKVNGNSYNLDITSNTNTMVAAEISTDQLQALVSDMNKSASLQLIAGSSPPATISLAGSNTVIAAYLTCADISEPTGDSTGGSNPFSSPTN